MKKIEKRAVLCMILAAVLLLGLGVYLYRFVRHGASWASFPSNRHLYNSSGQLASGTVADRDGDILTQVDGDGRRTYYDSAAVRRATLHVVGDPAGNIGTGALTAFAGRLSGYNLVTGAYSPLGSGNTLELTIDAHYNYVAHQAMDGRKGTVGVYNYKTGEVLCMMSNPSFDPLDPPAIEDGDERWEGVYLNRFLSTAVTSGSVFKTVTMAAAIENIPDLYSRKWDCTGSVDIGGSPVTCQDAHGEMGIEQALAKSCNAVFAELAVELGAEVMQAYTDKAGLSGSYSVSGIATEPGRFTFAGATENELGWAGCGQHHDRVNPCSLMVYMGAVANGGQAAVPQLIQSVHTSFGFSTYWYREKQTDVLIEPGTAGRLADAMSYTAEYTGKGRFGNIDICVKSGTAEVGGGKQPNAWFTGFIRDPAHPYAFVVLVENGGGGSSVAGAVAAQVLDPIVNGY
ncbi:penicillin-binding protein [Clostridiaceae bacterium]|nr:penicillin-binding protein [Clostridiaceae bacterium]NBI82954.1 penicillin-binding protein [Clostridiaceae bacterium]